MPVGPVRIFLADPLQLSPGCPVDQVDAVHVLTVDRAKCKRPVRRWRPSPDGTFAFRTIYGEDMHSIDLIDRTSGRQLQRIGEEDSDRTYWHPLWAPDSKRFALMTRLG